MYLLDTNTVSYFLRGEGDVARRMLACRREDLALSSLTDYELWMGVFKARWPQARVEKMFSGLAHLPRLNFTAMEAALAAQTAAALAAAGRSIGVIDGLIAGVALAHQAILVTRNVREFARIGGLRVEDWY